MAVSNVSSSKEFERAYASPDPASDRRAGHVSAVSWGAIFAGAAGAAALSLILLILGTGLGLSSVSPWANAGISGTAFTISTIIWLTVTQILASGMGGYLAGRLRTRWAAVHTDEVYFRDTAHGFLAWAIATLVTAVMLGSVVSSIVSGGVRAGGAVIGGAATAALTAAAGGVAAVGATAGKNGEPEAGPLGYFVDSLFRRDPNSAPTAGASGAPDANSATSSAEVSRILMNSLTADKLPGEDLRYISQLVAQRTGLSQQDAEKRVTDTIAQAKVKIAASEAAARDAADKARKASAYTALWLFISLLLGAFSASWFATYGGRSRDLHA